MGIVNLRNRIKRFFKNPLEERLTLADYYYPSFDKEILDASKESLETLRNRTEALQSKNFKLSFINMCIILILFINVHGLAIEFRLGGFKFQDIKDFRELLLLLSAFMTLFLSVNSIASSVISRFLQNAIKKSDNDNIRRLNSMIYLDSLNLFFEILTSSLNKNEKNLSFRSGGSFIVIYITIFWLVILFTYLSLIIFVHISVIIDILSDPSINIILSRFIIIFTILTDVSIIISGMFMTIIPVRFLDIGLLSELSELRQRDKQHFETRVDRLLD